MEPVLGTLINFLGMRKVFTRGIKSAQKHCLMVSLCYNLKKLLKFQHDKIKIEANSMKIQEILKENLPIVQIRPQYLPYIIVSQY